MKKRKHRPAKDLTGRRFAGRLGTRRRCGRGVGVGGVAVTAVDDGGRPVLPYWQIDTQGFLECVEKGVTLIDVVTPPRSYR